MPYGLIYGKITHTVALFKRLSNRNFWRQGGKVEINSGCWRWGNLKMVVR